MTSNELEYLREIISRRCGKRVTRLYRNGFMWWAEVTYPVQVSKHLVLYRNAEMSVSDLLKTP